MDIDKNKAPLLIKIIAGVVITIPVSFIAALLIQPQYVYRYSLIIALICIVSIISLFTARKGYIKITSILYIAFLMMMIFTSPGLAEV